MQEKVNEVFDALQELDMKPTPHNVSIMSGVYSFLREIYNEMEVQENVGTDNATENGSAADTDGRDND